MISDTSGQYLVRAARAVIQEYLKNRRETKPLNYPAELEQKKGVVVELYKKIPGSAKKELRGSAALLSFDKTIVDACAEAAIAACNDKRFSTLELQELPVILIHANVIESEPKQIFVRQPSEYLRAIVPMQDGLIMRKGNSIGILMPHTILQNKWSVKEALENLSVKAGLDKDGWQNPSSKIFRFRTQLFKEG